MKKMLILAALAATLVAATPQKADDSPWMVRVRGVGVEPANKSDAIPALEISASDTIHVSSKTIPEVDFSYFFTDNWSAELILTVPQQHTVTQANVGALGTFKELPPTLTAQYHFLPKAAVNPYLGVGLNLTLISDVNLAVPGASPLPLKLSSSSVGVAGQAGVDIQVAPKWFLNLDVKYVQIKSDVKLANGTKVSAVQVNPMLYGVGIGYRF